MAPGIELVVGSAPRMKAVLRAFEGPFREASAVCESRLNADDVEVHVIDAPDEVIPEWGLGGYTYGPRTVVIAVEPDHLLEPVDVLSTLVHEIHHAVRWRSQGPDSSLADRLVTEGLAQVFETEVTGRHPLYAQGGVSGDQRALAGRYLDEAPVDERRWFFGSADLPRWFGYRLGYDAISTALATLGLDAAALAGAPTSAFEQWLQ